MLEEVTTMGRSKGQKIQGLESGPKRKGGFEGQADLAEELTQGCRSTFVG
jgi:hypothetical protein